MFHSIAKRTFANTAANRHAKFQVIGRLGADAVKRVSGNGNEFYTYSVASALGKKDAKTTWITVAAFNPPDFFPDAMKKGNLVYVEGRITSTENTKEDGEKVYGYNFSQDTFRVLDYKNSDVSE